MAELRRKAKMFIVAVMMFAAAVTVFATARESQFPRQIVRPASEIRSYSPLRTSVTLTHGSTDVL